VRPAAGQTTAHPADPRIGQGEQPPKAISKPGGDAQRQLEAVVGAPWRDGPSTLLL